MRMKSLGPGSRCCGLAGSFGGPCPEPFGFAQDRLRRMDQDDNIFKEEDGCPITYVGHDELGMEV